MAVRVPLLEIHAANACNLTCESCSHFSNNGHKGMLSLADAEAVDEQLAHADHSRFVPHAGGRADAQSASAGLDRAGGPLLAAVAYWL